MAKPKFKVGEHIVCFYNDNGSGNYIGQHGVVTAIEDSEKYPYKTDFCSAGLGDHEVKKFVPNKFKVGDRIRNVSQKPPLIGGNRGKLGKVVEVNGSDHYSIKYDDGAQGAGEGIHYEKLTKKSLMQKVSTMMKRLLDADTQTLVKAGFINGDLDLTDEGKEALYAILFDANKTALVAAAKEALTESKED